MGIDPGVGIVGYSFVEYKQTKTKDIFTLISSGSIQTSGSLTHAKRLKEVRDDLDYLIKKFKPDCASIEKLFYFRNKTTIIPVAQARGVIVLTLEDNNIPMYEYTPNAVKCAVTGSGKASKGEVKVMLSNFIEIDKNIKLDDTIDSIAIAICHANNILFSAEAE